MASRTQTIDGQPSQSAQTFGDLQAGLFADGFSFSGYERDLVALNLGSKRYLDISGISGADSVTDGRGSIAADFDNDGDLDIFLRAMHGDAHHLFRNNTDTSAGFVRISLRGVRSGRDAFGAEVRLKTSAGILTKIKSGGSGFVSQSDPRLLFGLGGDAAAEWLEVTWPTGTTQRFAGPVSGSSIEIVEGGGEPRTLTEQRFELPDPFSLEEKSWHDFGLDPDTPLPDVAVRLFDGGESQLSRLVRPDQKLLLNFWATWCRPCAEEMPELEKIHRGGKASLMIVGITVEGESSRDSVQTFVDRLDISYPVVWIEPADLERLLGTQDPGVPVSLVVDHDLKPVQVLVGWSDKTAEELNRLSLGLE